MTISELKHKLDQHINTFGDKGHVFIALDGDFYKEVTEVDSGLETINFLIDGVTK